MATARKPYCRIETSLLREPWPDNIKLALVKLVMVMVDRWARDRIQDPDEACRITLSMPQVMEISGKRRADIASKSLRCLADFASISVERRGDFHSIYWPKLAETQGWLSGHGGKRASRLPESAPAPAPAPVKEQEQCAPHTGASPPVVAGIPPAVALSTHGDLMTLMPRDVAENLARLLSKYPGSHAEKADFIYLHGDSMIAQLEAEGVKAAARNWGALKGKIFSWYEWRRKYPDGKPGPKSFDQRKTEEIDSWDLTSNHTT